MTRAQRLELLKQIEQDIHVCSLESTLLDDAKSCAIHSVIEELEQEPFINKPCVSSGVCEHDKNEVLDKIRAEILEEKEHAYADFERYKVEYLGQDWEDALDSLPQDDFRYGMERAIELIDKYKAESEK